MPLPTAPAAAPVTAAPAPAASTAAASENTTEKVKGVIKQFGPSKDAEGNVIPAPTPAGVDMTELAKKIYETIVANVGDKDAFFAACDALEKPSVPGHKAGRCAYNLANYVLGVADLVEAATRVRKGGGAAVKLQKQAATIDKLKSKLAALGLSDDDLAALLAG